VGVAGLDVAGGAGVGAGVSKGATEPTPVLSPALLTFPVLTFAVLISGVTSGAGTAGAGIDAADGKVVPAGFTRVGVPDEGGRAGVGVGVGVGDTSNALTAGVNAGEATDGRTGAGGTDGADASGVFAGAISTALTTGANAGETEDGKTGADAIGAGVTGAGNGRAAATSNTAVGVCSTRAAIGCVGEEGIGLAAAMTGGFGTGTRVGKLGRGANTAV
jgi:hypothetical protein